MATGERQATVLAVTSVWRVPPDVLLEAPYLVAVVRAGEGPELVAVGDEKDEIAVGERVGLVRDEVARDGETAELWRMRRLAGYRGGRS